MKHSRRISLLAVSMLLVAACADDTATDDTSADTTTTTVATTTTSEATTTTSEAETTTSTAGETEVDLASFCDTAIQADMTASAGPDVDFEAATQEEIQEALGEFGDRLMPMLEDLGANAPEELSEAIGTITEGMQSGMETGEDPMGSPEFQEADATVDQFILENCEDLTVVEVLMVDYAFEELPDTMEPGLTAIRARNDGEELHELVLFRIDDDVDASIEELLELPEDEVDEMIEFHGFAVAAPGEEAVTFADLEPGRYGMICFIPVGTTSMEDLPEEDDDVTGPPHFTQGMVAEFEVEA